MAETKIMTLTGHDFMERGKNIIFTGSTGKSRLTSGVLRQAIIYGSRGHVYNAQNLVDELYASLADQSTRENIRMASGNLCNFT